MKKMDRAEVLRQLGLSPDKPTVLIMAGSFGVFQYPQDLQQHYQGEPGFSDYRDYRQE